MRKYLNIGLAVIGLLVAGNASAAVVVTVYDALDPMVSALTRVALMVSDNSFTSTAVAFGIAGLTVGAIMVLASIAQGRVVNPVSFAVPFLVGGVVLAAMLAPKEDIIVQDRTTLQTETVFSFPAPMANLLSWLTQARDAIIDVIDTSAPPGPATIWQYRHNVNGITFDVLMRALSKAGTLPDQYLNATVEKYIADCMPWAVSIGAADWNDMNSGNVEFYDLLAKGAVGSQYTGYFTAANKQGIFDTCKNVWDNHLSTALQDASHQDLFKKAIYGACEEHGIVTDLRASTASGSLSGANAYCENIFAASVHAAVGESGAPPWGLGSVNAWRWMRQLYLGSKLYTWALNAPPGALANYNQILDRVGWAQQAAQWMPVLRATLIAIGIVLLPLGVLFLMTGAGFRAIIYILGMVVFVLIWEILDAAAHSFLSEWAFRALGDAVQHQIGLVGLAKQAPASVKIMTAFGTAKVLSATLATSFMYVVFRYGGMAMPTMAQSFATGAKEAGSDAMRKTTEPVQHGQWMQALNQSSAAMFASHAVGGAGNYMAAGAYNAATTAHTANSEMRLMGNATPGSAAQQRGEVAGGTNAGSTIGAHEAAKAVPGATPGQAARTAATGNKMTEMAAGRAAMHAFGNTGEFNDYVAGKQAQMAQVGGEGASMASLSQKFGGDFNAIAQSLGAANVARQAAGLATLSAIASAMGKEGFSIQSGSDGSLAARIDDGMVATIASNGNITIAGNGETMQQLMNNGYLPESATASQKAALTARGGTAVITPNPAEVARHLGDEAGDAGNWGGPVSMSLNGSTRVDGSSTSNYGASAYSGQKSDGMAAVDPAMRGDLLNHLASQLANQAQGGASHGDLVGSIKQAEIQTAEMAGSAVGVQMNVQDQESGQTSKSIMAGFSGGGTFGKGGSNGFGGSVGANGQFIAMGRDAHTESVSTIGSGMLPEIERNTDEIAATLESMRHNGASVQEMRETAAGMLQQDYQEYTDRLREAQLTAGSVAAEQREDAGGRVNQPGAGVNGAADRDHLPKDWPAGWHKR